MSKLNFIVLTSLIMAFCLMIGVSHGQKLNAKKAARVIRIDSIKVEGKIQKPEAFYFLQRSQLNFDGLEPKRSFIPMIIKSVDKAPF